MLRLLKFAPGEGACGTASLLRPLPAFKTHGDYWHQKHECYKLLSQVLESKCKYIEPSFHKRHRIHVRFNNVLGIWTA